MTVSATKAADRPLDPGPVEDCPVDAALAVIAGKWKMLLLRPLYLHGPMRYGALLQRVPRISTKELTRNLHELEYAGLLKRTVLDSKGNEVYELTALGETLGSTFRALGEFGTSYLRSRRRAPDRRIEA